MSLQFLGNSIFSKGTRNMKGEKGMTSLGLVIIAISILSVIALTLFFFPSLQFTLNISDRSWTRATTIAQIVIAVFAFLAFIYTYFANERSEKLFVGANIPLIDVTPIGVGQTPGDKGTYFTTTFFEIANYSGFKAFNIGIDLKYGDKPWILEWMKADTERAGKNHGQKIIDGRAYMSAPPILLKELGSGDSKKEKITLEPLSVSGMLDLKKEVCDRDTHDLPVWVRITWQNKKKHVFDEIHRYKLICTTAGNPSDPNQIGYSFAFIPEGIIYKKDTKYALSKD
jgi:hypothetical protein